MPTKRVCNVLILVGLFWFLLLLYGCVSYKTLPIDNRSLYTSSGAVRDVTLDTLDSKFRPTVSQLGLLIPDIIVDKYWKNRDKIVLKCHVSYQVIGYDTTVDTLRPLVQESRCNRYSIISSRKEIKPNIDTLYVGQRERYVAVNILAKNRKEFKLQLENDSSFLILYFDDWAIGMLYNVSEIFADERLL